MARTRLLKPGFFTNDVLLAIEPLGRILFAGLWCHADRLGRLEDRPGRLKIQILPCDNCDVDELLEQLHERGFIERYSVSEVSYIQILSFDKHQNPHKNEIDSVIPIRSKERSTRVKAQSTRAVYGLPSPVNSKPSSADTEASSPIKLDPPKTSALRASQTKKTRFPIDFAVNQNNAETATREGIALESALESFREFHLSKGSLFADWNLALNTWIRNENRFKRGGKPDATTEYTARIARERSILESYQRDRDSSF